MSQILFFIGLNKKPGRTFYLSIDNRDDRITFFEEPQVLSMTRKYLPCYNKLLQHYYILISLIYRGAIKTDVYKRQVEDPKKPH